MKTIHPCYTYWAYLCALLLFSCGKIQASPVSIDSLQQSLDKLPAYSLDAGKTHIACCRHSSRRDPREACCHAREALQISQWQRDTSLMIQAYLWLSRTYDVQAYFDSTRDALNRAEELSIAIKDTQLLGDTYRSLGITTYRQGDFETSWNYYTHAENLFKEIGAMGYLSKIYNNKAIILQMRQEYDQAMLFLDKSLAIMDSLRDAKGRASTLINIGIMYMLKHEYMEALKVFQKTHDIYTQLDDQVGLLNTYLNMGTLYQWAEDWDHALPYYRAGRMMSEQLNMRYDVAKIEANIADVLFHQGEYALSIASYENAICQQTEFGDSLGLGRAYLGLAEAYGEIGDIEAFEYAVNICLQITRSEPHDRAYLGALSLQAALYIEQEKWQDAYVIANTLYERAKAVENIFQEEQACRLLSTCHAHYGRYEQAYTMETRARTLLDSLHKTQDIYDFVRQELALQTQAEQEAKRAQAREEEIKQSLNLQKTRMARNYFLAGLVLMFFIVTLLLLRYMTNRKYTEALRHKNIKLLKLDEERSQLISVMTHDLRTPAGQIQALSQELFTMIPPDNPLKQRFQLAMGKATQRLSHTIDRILALKALETQGISPIPRSFAPQQIINEVAATAKPTLNQKSLSLYLSPIVCHCTVFADPHYLQEILENYLSNAIKFSAPGSSIEMGYICKGPEVQLYVKDQGPGIRPQELPHVFEKFRKLSNRPTQGEPSSGLGLAIVKEYANQMEARVWCESKPGMGSTFWVALNIGGKPCG